MIKLFEFILHGCWHKWEEKEKKPVKWHDSTPCTSLNYIGSGFRITYHCPKCGRYKKKEI